MSQKPTMKIKYGLGIGVELFIYHPDIQDNTTTYLTQDVLISGASLNVISSSGIESDDYILIGSYGDKQAEIVQVSNSTNNTLTISALTLNHNRGDAVTVIPYNQIVVSRSTDNGVTYAVLSAVNIQPNNDYTYLERPADDATDMYKFRFYNSTKDLYSDYSDAVVATGFADNTVYAIKKRALNQLGEKIDNTITDEFLNDSLWEARRIIDNDPNALKFPFRFKRNNNIGSIIPGTYSIALPTTLKDPYSNHNIISVRIGKENRPLQYQDIKSFNQHYQNIAQTTLNGNVADTDVMVTLTDSGDFTDSGDIYVAAATVAGTIDIISYTSNSKTTNILSGVTGIATGGHLNKTQVWQGVTFGLPENYTLDPENKCILFDVPFADEYAGENIYMDYYSTLPEYDSDSDVLDEPNTDIFVNYLKYKIKYKRKNGDLNIQSDSDYLLWEKGKNDLILKQYTGQTIRMFPDIN